MVSQLKINGKHNLFQAELLNFYLIVFSFAEKLHRAQEAALKARKALIKPKSQRVRVFA